MNRLLTILSLIAASCIPSFATWTRVQAVQANYCASGTTCTATVTSPTAGHLLAVAAMYTGSSVTISSVSGLGTWVHPSGCQANASGYQAIDWAYNLSASTGTSITVTFSASASYVALYFFEYAGTSPFTYDTCAVVNGGSSYTNPPAGSITTTGTNDLAIAGVNAGSATFSSTSAVSPSPWTTPNVLYNGGNALDDAMNFSARTTQALFTGSAADYTVGSTVAFKDSSSAAFVRKRVVAMWQKSDGLAASASGTTSLATQIANDMGTNEKHPEGVPSSYDFYTASFLGYGNSVGSNAAMEWWAEVQVGAGGNSTTNTIVQVTSPVLCALNNTTWSCTTYTASQMADELDTEDWTDPSSLYSVTVPSLVTVSTTSFKVPEISGNSNCNGTSGSDATGDCLTHFYPSNRQAVSPTNLNGVVSCATAQLVLINSGGTDDRASANYVMEVGADSYTSTTSVETPPIEAVGGSKFKIVTIAPRSICMTTMTQSALAANPPPISTLLAGDNP